MQNLTIQYIGSFEQAGTLLVHELANAALPWTIYLSLKDDALFTLPDTSLGGVALQSNADFAMTLPEPVLQFTGVFKVNKYRLYANSLTDVTNVYAHYGLLRAGGIQFSIADTIASEHSDYLMQIDFYALDLPVICQVYKQHLSNYPLVQQLSFDIAGYVNGRRQNKEVIRYTNLYPKLLVNAKLSGNDLLITCKDTNGLSAARHIAESLGIAEETVSATAEITMIGLDIAGQVSQKYQLLAAHANYSDDPLHVVLPKLQPNIVAVQVSVDYLLNLQTIGETIRLNNSIVLTDTEVSNLHPINASELANGIRIGIVALTTNNEPIMGARITIDGKTYMTNEQGLAELLLQPGVYIYQVQYGTIVKTLTLTVAVPQVIQIIFDVVLLAMTVELVGSDDYALPNIELDVDGAKLTTNKQGVILLRGVQGRVFRISHKLGQTLHEQTVSLDSKSARLHLYNEFDDELAFFDEFT